MNKSAQPLPPFSLHPAAQSPYTPIKLLQPSLSRLDTQPDDRLLHQTLRRPKNEFRQASLKDIKPVLDSPSRLRAELAIAKRENLEKDRQISSLRQELTYLREKCRHYERKASREKTERILHERTMAERTASIHSQHSQQSLARTGAGSSRPALPRRMCDVPARFIDIESLIQKIRM
jgi:hypothetical protein